MSALPPALAAAPALRVLERAIAQGRLGHAILLTGPTREDLGQAALHLAARLLGTPAARVAVHPDLFHLRPSGKARTIKTEDTRGLIRVLNQTSNQGGGKVALLHEAERWQPQGANAFLKTLEEPPAGTTIFLLTTRPYDLLATIRSRCLFLRLPGAPQPVEDAAWNAWKERYGAWLGRLRAGAGRQPAGRAALFVEQAALAEAFQGILERLADDSWKALAKALPEDVDKDEKEALETGHRKGLRARLLVELELATRAAAVASEGELPARALTEAVAALERSAGLLELNYKEEGALELFLLASLRAWGR